MLTGLSEPTKFKESLERRKSTESDTLRSSDQTLDSVTKVGKGGVEREGGEEA